MKITTFCQLKYLICNKGKYFLKKFLLCLSCKIDVLWVVSVLQNVSDLFPLTLAICKTVLKNMYVGNDGTVD